MRSIAVCLFFSIILLYAVGKPLAAQTARPTFLFLLEGKGVPTGTVHAYRVTSSRGELIEAPGSPFNAGLVPKQIVVDPTGRFMYVTNSESQDITGFSIDPFTGALTEMA